jgi:hypothetical protein
VAQSKKKGAAGAKEQAEERSVQEGIRKLVNGYRTRFSKTEMSFRACSAENVFDAARLLAEFAISKNGQQLISNLGKVPGRSDVQPKIGVDRVKLRMILPEDEGKTAHYQKWFDDLFGKGS